MKLTPRGPLIVYPLHTCCAANVGCLWLSKKPPGYNRGLALGGGVQLTVIVIVNDWLTLIGRLLSVLIFWIHVCPVGTMLVSKRILSWAFNVAVSTVLSSVDLTTASYPADGLQKMRMLPVTPSLLPPLMATAKVHGWQIHQRRHLRSQSFESVGMTEICRRYEMRANSCYDIESLVGPRLDPPSTHKGYPLPIYWRLIGGILPPIIVTMCILVASVVNQKLCTLWRS